MNDRTMNRKVEQNGAEAAENRRFILWFLCYLCALLLKMRFVFLIVLSFIVLRNTVSISSDVDHLHVVKVELTLSTVQSNPNNQFPGIGRNGHRRFRVLPTKAAAPFSKHSCADFTTNIVVKMHDNSSLFGRSISRHDPVELHEWLFR